MRVRRALFVAVLACGVALALFQAMHAAYRVSGRPIRRQEVGAAGSRSLQVERAEKGASQDPALRPGRPARAASNWPSRTNPLIIHVFGPRGERLSGVRIEALMIRDHVGWEVFANETTDAEGRCEFDDPRPDRVVIRIDPPASLNLAVALRGPLALDRSSLEVTLTKAGGIHGHVVDGDSGRGIPGVRLSLRVNDQAEAPLRGSSRAPGRIDIVAHAEQYSGASGEFSFVGLEWARDFWVIAEHQTRDVGLLCRRVAPSERDVVFRVPTSPAITVRDERGNAVAGAEVVFAPAGIQGKSGWYVESPAPACIGWTNALGHAHYCGTYEGPVMADVTPPSGRPDLRAASVNPIKRPRHDVVLGGAQPYRVVSGRLLGADRALVQVDSGDMTGEFVAEESFEMMIDPSSDTLVRALPIETRAAVSGGMSCEGAPVAWASWSPPVLDPTRRDAIRVGGWTVLDPQVERLALQVKTAGTEVCVELQPDTRWRAGLLVVVGSESQGRPLASAWVPRAWLAGGLVRHEWSELPREERSVQFMGLDPNDVLWVLVRGGDACAVLRGVKSAQGHVVVAPGDCEVRTIQLRLPVGFVPRRFVATIRGFGGCELVARDGFRLNGDVDTQEVHSALGPVISLVSLAGEIINGKVAVEGEGGDLAVGMLPPTASSSVIVDCTN